MTKQKHAIWTRSFLSVFMASLLIFTAFYLLLPTLPLYLIKTLDAGPENTGIILAAFTMTAVIIRPVTGYMIDRQERKWIYLFGLIFFMLSFAGDNVANNTLLL